LYLSGKASELILLSCLNKKILFFLNYYIDDIII